MHTDLIIIGAGPGGYETALEAARRGYTVTLFNGGQLGGTCLNEGCIPTKCFCRDSEVVALFKEADRFGVDDYTFAVDFNKILSRKTEVVAGLRSGVDAMLNQAGVNVVAANAAFKDNHTVVADGTEYDADNIIIATGSESKTLPVKGADLACVKHSRQMLELDYVPESLTIIGGGVIGMEFASIFANLGSKVTVVEYARQILPPFDSDIAKRLKQTLSKRGINIITGAQVTEIAENEFYEIIVTYSAKGKTETITSSDVMMAVGREPNFSNLNLDAAGVEYTPKGIVTDDNMRTNIENIYAVGDVNGRMMLAHVASYQGLRALNAIGKKADNIKFNIVPSAVFTLPECGMVGLTEEQCKERKIEVVTGKSFFRANGKACAMGETEGLCKLIFDKESRRLLGAHIMGVEAADLAQQCADMMNSDATIESMTDIIFGHPTISEVILSAVHSVR